MFIRALRTINIREEDEKLNVWVAYFNLENEYGSPREVSCNLQMTLHYVSFFLLSQLILICHRYIYKDAVKKIFQRAVQNCDPKKVHLALLGMYERTQQHQLADELLDRMTRRFRTSRKVSLSICCLYLEQIYDLHDAIVDLVTPHSIFSRARRGR